jgi:TatD DNase family protein
MPDNQDNFFELIDSHAHLDMSHYGNDRDETIRRSHLAGIVHIINAGIDLPSSLKAVELTQQYDFISAAVGIHPQESKDTGLDEIEQIVELARKSRVVAIGEIGLDFFRDYSPHAKQIEVFKWQLEIAVRLNLPVAIHCRQAEATLISTLEAWLNQSPSRQPGVIHCFSGNLETAQTYLSMGFYISLGAYIGYPSSKIFQKVVRQLPLERLLLETDCPFLPPQKHRGQRNEPGYVVETAKELARIKETTMEEVAQQTTNNARELFNFD